MDLAEAFAKVGEVLEAPWGGELILTKAQKAKLVRDRKRTEKQKKKREK